MSVESAVGHVIVGGDAEHDHKWDQGYLVGDRLVLAVCRDCRAESVYVDVEQRRRVIDAYHRLWYDEAGKGLTWGTTTYMGVKVWKHPTDMWLYAELIHQIQPALIIETGTAFGGSALYFAHLMDQLGHGKVLTIDLNPVQKSYPHHPRISYLGGASSTHMDTVAAAGEAAIRAVLRKGAVMVVLDSNHAAKHVGQELACYASLVTPSSYLVVEDTELNGHPIDPERGIGPPEGKGPGPYEAVEKWLPQHPEFVEDKRLPARMLWSAHTWLRRERS